MDQHYYAACVYGWAVADTPAAALARLAADISTETIAEGVANTGGLRCFVCKVSADITAGYEILCYVPIGVETSDAVSVRLLNQAGHCTLLPM